VGTPERMLTSWIVRVLIGADIELVNKVRSECDVLTFPYVRATIWNSAVNPY
jgi:hypothetical protein